jgi:hypothetical protein
LASFAPKQGIKSNKFRKKVSTNCKFVTLQVGKELNMSKFTTTNIWPEDERDRRR